MPSASFKFPVQAVATAVLFSVCCRQQPIVCHNGSRYPFSYLGLNSASCWSCKILAPAPKARHRPESRCALDRSASCISSVLEVHRAAVRLTLKRRYYLNRLAYSNNNAAPRKHWHDFANDICSPTVTVSVRYGLQ